MKQTNSGPRFSIIILNWNGKTDTLACLDSLKKIDHPSFDIIVVDNGSIDDSCAAIKAAFPSVHLIETGKNLGFAEGNNVGIRHALENGADWLFLLNNDTVVDSTILHAFQTQIEKDPKAAIIGGTPYLFEDQNRLDHLGGKWNKKTAQFDFIGLRDIDSDLLWKQNLSLDYACGCALLIKRDVFEAVGLLEPRFFLIWEEADFCFRAKRAGFTIQTCRNAKLWHKVSASFKGKNHSTYFWWRNRLFWIERNCSPREKFCIYIKVIIPELLHLYKISLLKRFQIALTRLISPKKDQQERLGKLKKHKAALQGAGDYFRRRFGNAPPSIFQ